MLALTKMKKARRSGPICSLTAMVQYLPLTCIAVTIHSAFQVCGFDVSKIPWRTCRLPSPQADAVNPTEILPTARRRQILNRSALICTLVGWSMMALRSEEARADQQPFEQLVLDKGVLDRLKPETVEQPRIPLPTQGSKANTLEGTHAMATTPSLFQLFLSLTARFVRSDFIG
jgi:hypothetical protein